MSLIRLIQLIGLAAAGQPALAADPIMQGAVMPGWRSGSGQAHADSLRVRDNGIAPLVSSNGVLAQSGASAYREKETRRRSSESATAEGALLAGAGLLSTAPYLAPHPICADQRGEPSFQCQIVKKVHSSR